MISADGDIDFLLFNLADFVVDEGDFSVDKDIKADSGSFGSVVKVENKDEKIFARKELKINRAFGHQPKYVYREVIALSKTNCISLSKLRGFSISQKRDKAYIYTDFYPNGNLDDYVTNSLSNRYSTLTAQELTVIAYGIAYGCYKFHELGFIHRDIKPENIMLDENREPVIVDFGTARTTESEFDTDGFTKIVTPGYGAPEVANSMSQTAVYTKSVDVFSYGRVLFAMALLQSPLDNSKELYIPIKLGIRNPPITIPLPDELKTLIEECQSFEDILGRFQSG